MSGFTKMRRNFPPVVALGLTILLAVTTLAQQSASPDNKALDVRSSLGNAHLGNDGDARHTGLPAYPGSRLHKNGENDSNANLDIFTSAFGFKLAVAKYDSDDSPEKVAAFYRDALKKYGRVLECRTTEHGGHVNVDHDDHDSGKSKPLTCEGDNSGNVIELKVGTEENQHVVAVEPAEKGSGSTYALVYVYMRGKEGDI